MCRSPMVSYHYSEKVASYSFSEQGTLLLSNHDDVIKWKHFPRCWPLVRRIHRSPVNSPHKGQWREALMFSLIRVWINGWVNNREAGDLRRYRAHYGVIVMLRSRPNDRHFPDNIFKCIFLNENVLISINVIPALVQIMACSRPDDNPLSEPMMVSLLTHICATRPQ